MRAINVGGHNVKMDRLRKLFEELGFSDVESFIASGNIIFTTPDEEVSRLERRIEKHLHESLGYEVATFLRTDTELAEIAAYVPFPDAAGEEETTLYVTFLAEAPHTDLRRKIEARSTDIDRLHVHNRELYWLYIKRFGESQLANGGMDRTDRLSGTNRNFNTVRRLAAKYPPQ